MRYVGHSKNETSTRKIPLKRVWKDLQEAGERVSQKRVARLTREEGLPREPASASARRRWASATSRWRATRWRQFDAERPNQRWVGDTTEFVIGSTAKIAEATTWSPTQKDAADQVLYDDVPGTIELIADPESPTEETDGYISKYGGGAMFAEPNVFGRLFVTLDHIDERLVLVSRKGT